MKKIEHSIKDQVSKIIDLMSNNVNFIVETGEKGMYHLIIALDDTDIKIHFETTYYNVLDTPLYYNIVKKDGIKTIVLGKLYMNPEQDDLSKNKIVHSEGGVTGSYEYYFYTLNTELPSIEFIKED